VSGSESRSTLRLESVGCDRGVRAEGSSVAEPMPLRSRRTRRRTRPQSLFDSASTLFLKAASLVAMGCAVAAAIWPATASAVVLLVRGNDRPVGGYLVREDAEVIVIRDTAEPGKGREREFRKSDLLDIIVTVSTDRLARLRAGKPDDYRDYAEELAEKRRDPEARDMALRLFLISAHRAPERLGRSSMLAMAEIARDADEANRFRAMAFLLDPNHDSQLLPAADSRSAGVAKADPREASRESNRESSPMLLALRQLRRGERDAARKIAERITGRGEIAAVPGVLSNDEFLAACREKPLAAPTLQKILRAEIALLDQAAGNRPGRAVVAEPATTDEPRWQRELRLRGPAAALPLDLERLSEFDPRLCEFREGQWTLPRDP